MALAKRSPYIHSQHRVSGLILANNTCVSQLFSKNIELFQTLIKKKSFLQKYEENHVDINTFQQSHTVVNGLLDEYEKIQSEDYLHWTM